MNDLPARKFELNLDCPIKVKVPPEVCEEGTAEIVGYESGTGNTRARVRSDTWLYYLKFPNESGWFIASEEELTKWQG
jgi:hypothetical protein